jgi:glycosyltransferase involved in cell wall biosynthesis
MIPQIAGLTNKKIRFIIVGLKDSSSILNQVLEYTKRNGLSDRVEVFIDVSREKLLGILRTSKVFLHPARGEHFGVSIAEAMAAGCIPLVHNTGGPREFVPERWRFNESKEAAQKIERAILEWSPNKAEEIICLAQAFSEARFSAKFLETFEAYEETYLQYQPSKD